MRGNNNQPDDSISDLKAAVAVLKKEVELINRQAESRDRWVQGIGSALIVAVFVWIGQNAVGSAQKANPVSIPNTSQK